jgi:hypothetical protein
MEEFVIFFDIETQCLFGDVVASSRDEQAQKMPISCASCLSIPSDLLLGESSADEILERGVMTTFWRDGSVGNDMKTLVELLNRAEMIVGYNLFGFDYKVLAKHRVDPDDPTRWRDKTHDLFCRVRDHTKQWPKLDSLLALNNVPAKLGDGILAVKLWNEGKREELRTYCEGDVLATARLALLSELKFAPDAPPLPRALFGAAGALAALRHCVGE